MSREIITSRAAALGAAAGGLLVAAGAALPWLTLYGGLHPLPGYIGAYGRVLLVGGLACATGAALLPLAPRIGGRILLGIAAILLVFGGWLALSGVPAMLASLRENPFLLADRGVGPYVVVAGAMLMLAAGASLSSRAERGTC